MKRHNIFFTLRQCFYQVSGLVSRLVDKRSVSVLVYHSISAVGDDRYAVTPKNFERQIKKIAKSSNFIALSDITKPNFTGRSCVAITFDDGYKDILHILPIVKKYRLKPTIFILSDTKNADRKELENEHEFLNTHEIKRLLEAGFEIGSHSATHADLTTLSTKRLVQEITRSKGEIEKRFSVKVNYFAYPKGKYNEKTISAVENASYTAGFSIDPGTIHGGLNKFILPRVIIDSTHIDSEFPGIYSSLSFFVRKSTNGLKLWEKFLSI